MDTGLRLKYHRLKKKISLEEVAAGILSPRELKKIESGLKEPSLAHLEALCKKLEIPLAAKDNPVGKVLVKNFKNSLLHPQNKGKLMEQYSDIKDHPLLHLNEDIELEYEIQQIRYFIITGDLDNAEEKIKQMERFKEFMNQEQFYLIHKYKGNYNYLLSDYGTALKLYLLAEKIAPDSIMATEIGDLYYSIGISATQCWETDLAHKYTDMALKIYQQEFIPKRIVECHSNIALTQYQFGNFKAAAEHYKNAYTICQKIDNEILKYTTEFNHAYTNFLLQKYEDAIEHILSAMRFIPAEYTSDLLMCYCLLVKCNYELENGPDTKRWAKKGLEIIEAKNLNLDTPTNNVFKEAYIEFMALVYLVNEDYEHFERIVIQNLIPSFENNNNFYEIGYYCGHMGNVYYKLEKYEKSAKYLFKAKESFKNLMINKKRSVQK